MTQPAVSLAIKELEQYYGVALFDRIGKRLKITEALLSYGLFHDGIASFGYLLLYRT